MVLLSQSELHLMESKQSKVRRHIRTNGEVNRNGSAQQKSVYLSSPVVSLLQKFLEALKFTDLQVCFICVLVAYECAAVGKETRCRLLTSKTEQI